MSSSDVANKRLKIGLVVVAIGLIYQVIDSTNASLKNSTKAGGDLVCATYGCPDWARTPDHQASGLGWLIALVGFWIVMGHLTGKAAAERGRDYSSFFWLGFLLPIIGLIYVSTLSPKEPQKVLVVESSTKSGSTKTCPFCAEEIQAAAIFCKHCKNSLEIGKE